MQFLLPSPHLLFSERVEPPHMYPHPTPTQAHQVSAGLERPLPLRPDKAAQLGEHIPQTGCSFTDRSHSSCWGTHLKTKLLHMYGANTVLNSSLINFCISCSSLDPLARSCVTNCNCLSKLSSKLYKQRNTLTRHWKTSPCRFHQLW